MKNIGRFVPNSGFSKRSIAVLSGILGIQGLSVLVSCSANEGVTSVEETVVGSAEQALESSTVIPVNRIYGQIGLSNSPTGAVGTKLISKLSWNGSVQANGDGGIFAYQYPPSSATNPLLKDYVISTEASTAGINYTLSASVYNSRSVYLGSVGNLKLQTKAVSPNGINADLKKCVGLTKIVRRQGTCAATSPIVPISGASLASSPFFMDGGAIYAVVPAGESYTDQLEFVSGSSDYLDKIRTQQSVSLSGTCDQETELCIPVPTPCTSNCPAVDCSTDPSNPACLGKLIGPYDLTNSWPGAGVESWLLSVVVGSGPAGNFRYYLDSTSSPLEKPVGQTANYWTLPNLVPGNYASLSASGGIGSGRTFTQFYTRSTQVAVTAAQTTTVSQTTGGVTQYPFVMTPGWVKGAISLSMEGRPSNTSLKAITFASGTYPDNRYSTSVRASSALGDSSATSFTLTPNAQGMTYSGSYLLPVPSLYNTTSTWSPELQLDFSNTFNAALPNDYRSGRLSLSRAEASPSIAAGASVQKDFGLCLVDVPVSFTLQGGEKLYAPRVRISGASAAYNISGSQYGYPINSQSKAETGAIQIPLTDGKYTVVPSATVVNASGITNEATFSDMAFEVRNSCSEIICKNVEVEIKTDKQCLSSGVARMHATIKNPNGEYVPSVYYTINGGTKQVLCSNNCTATSYDFDLPVTALQPCTNKIEFVAEVLTGIATCTPKNVAHVVYEKPGDGQVCPGGEECGDEGACVVGTNNVNVRNYAKLFTDVYAGTLNMEADSQIASSAKCLGAAFMGNRARIGDDDGVLDETLTMKNTSLLTKQLGATVEKLVADTSMTAASLLTTTFTAPTGWKEIPNNAVESLPPGSYGDVTIRSRATVTLSNGFYNMRSLKLEGDATLILDTAKGAIVINVQGTVDLYARAKYSLTAPNTAHLVSLYSNGASVYLHGSQEFPGSISAPNGEVALYTPTKVLGCVSGKTVRIEPSSQVLGQRFSGTVAPTCTDQVKNGLETDVDCGGTTCSARCATGKTCNVNADCANNQCISGVCGGTSASPITATLALQSGATNTNYCAQVNVTNGGTAAVSTWTVGLDLKGSVLSNFWSVNMTPATGTLYTATPVGWNANLNAGATTSFGFCGTRTSSTVVPVVTSAQ